MAGWHRRWARAWDLRHGMTLEDARGVSFGDDVRRDVRQGCRAFRRSPSTAAVVLCTLALAIGGAVTAFSISDAWLFRPLHFPAADRLVVAFMATATRPTEPAVWMPYRAYLSWKESARTFSSVSAVFFHAATWRTAADARSLVGMRVTPDFFATFGVPPLRGRPFTAADTAGTPVIVLSYGFWQRELGGAESAVGTTVTLSDIVYTVVGIMPADFDVRLLDRPEGAAYWTIFRPGEPGYASGGLGPVSVVGRLVDGVTIESARAEAAEIVRRSEEAYSFNFNQPDADGNRFVINLSSLQADNTRTVRATLLTVLAAAVGLLVIAAINVGVMLLSRGLGRRSEVAVRHALGAGRGRLVRQFLTESLVLSAASCVLGVGLAFAGLQLFVAWNPLGTLPANGAQLDARALAAAMLAMVVTTIVAGVVPAIRISSAGVGTALRGGERGRATAPGQQAQRAMLVGQIAISMVLLVSAALLARTVVQLRNEPLGFAVQDVTVAEIVLPTSSFDSNGSRNDFYRQFQERLLARPGIRAVAASTAPPLVGSEIATVNLAAVDTSTAPRMSAPAVTIGFFEALDIPIIAGRSLDRGDTPQGRPVAVLNERAARQLFGDSGSAIGKRLRLDDEDWREVVGVVGNVRTSFFNTLEWRTDPMVYRPADQGLSGAADRSATHLTLWMHIRANRPVPAAELRAATAAVGPRASVLSVRRGRDLVGDATRQPTFRMTLLLWFCGGTLLLAGIGVYGVVAQGVTERVREIAIRLALGANPRALTIAVVRTALLTAAAGLAVGAVLFTLLAQGLQSMLYGVGTSDTASLVIASLFLLGVVGIAALLPAVRAIRADTVRVLRT